MARLAARTVLLAFALVTSTADPGLAQAPFPSSDAATTERANTLLDRGVEQYQENDLPGALETFSEALDLFRRASDAKGEAQALGSAATVAAALGRHRQAVESGTAALKPWRALGDDTMVTNTLVTLASFYQAQGDLENALSHYRQALPRVGGEGFREATLAEPRWNAPYFWAAFTLTGAHGETGSAAEETAETLALLTGYSGEVTIERDGEEIAARPLMAVREGDVVQLPDKGRAVVVCRTDRAFDLDRSQRLSRELCTQGTELPAGSYAVVEPRGGRIQRVAGSFEPAPATRELPGDYGEFPVVLSPRNTALADVRPTVRWTESPGAVDYQIQWSGPGFPAFAKSRNELRCRTEELFDGPVTTCELDWPLDAPQLQQGGVYHLSVGAWLEAELQPRVAGGSNQVRILDPRRASQLRLVIDRTRSVPDVDEATRQQFLAGHHLQDEVYAEAIPAYRRVLELQPSAKVYATLGDAYRAIELYRFAAESYQQALGLAGEDVDRAAAEFGLGQVSYAWQRFHEAWEHFQKASAILDRLHSADLADEKKAAAEMAELAQSRMRR